MTNSKRKKKKKKKKISEYRRILKEIADELTKDDLRQLKFLCKDDIPSGRREEIDKAVDFLEDLEERELLSEGNVEYLRDLLVKIRRQDVAAKLPQSPATNQEAESSQSEAIEVSKVSEGPAEDRVCTAVLRHPVQEAKEEGEQDAAAAAAEPGDKSHAHKVAVAQDHGNTSDVFPTSSQQPWPSLPPAPSCANANSQPIPLTHKLEVSKDSGNTCSAHPTKANSQPQLTSLPPAPKLLPDQKKGKGIQSTDTVSKGQHSVSPPTTGLPSQMRVIVMCDRWMDGRVSTLNKDICSTLAKLSYRVACLVQSATFQDKVNAEKQGVDLMLFDEPAGIDNTDLNSRMIGHKIPFKADMCFGYQGMTCSAVNYHSKQMKCASAVLLHTLPPQYTPSDLEADDIPSHVKVGQEVDFLIALGPVIQEHWQTILNKEVSLFTPSLPLDLSPRKSICTPIPRVLFIGNIEQAEPLCPLLQIALFSLKEVTLSFTFIIRGAKSEQLPKVRDRVKQLINTDNCEVEVKLCNYSVDLLNYEIRGVSLLLLPDSKDGFSLTALNAIAAGVPVLVSSKSGLGRMIAEDFEERYRVFCLPSMAEERLLAECESSDREGLKCWGERIQEILNSRDHYFDLAYKLREEWLTRFSWEIELEKILQEMQCLGILPSFPSLSPIDKTKQSFSFPSASSSPVISEKAKTFASSQLKLPSDKVKYILLISPENSEQQPYLSQLSHIKWTAVFDFDRNSAESGVLSSCEEELQRRGVPACRMIPPEKGKDWKDEFTFPSGIPWIFVEGLPELERNVVDSVDWLTEIFNVIRRALSPVTFVVLWRSSLDHLLRTLNKLLTVVQLSALKDLVKLVMVNTNDQGERINVRFQDIADDWGVKIENLELAEVCNAIAMSSPQVWSDDMSFSIPTGEKREPKSLPPDDRWINSEMEVLYYNIGDSPDDSQGDNAEHFFRGGTISWYALEMGYAIKRHLWETIKEKVETSLGKGGTYRLRIGHDRGAGGTTSARMILYSFHLRFPCVSVKGLTANVINGIKTLHTFTELPVLILADCKQIRVEEFELDVLHDALAKEHVPCVLLEVSHNRASTAKSKKHKQAESSNEQPLFVAAQLDDKEADRFVNVYSEQAPTKAGRLRQHRSKASADTQTPFFYALIAFEEKFTGLEPFVRDCLENVIAEKHLHILTFIALAHRYAQLTIPATSFAKILGVRASLAAVLEDYLPNPTLHLLLEEEGKWRTRHYIIAKEMIEQLLTAPLKIHRENWRKHLAEKAIDFIRYMEEDVVNDLIVIRKKANLDSNSKSNFSPLIEDIYDDEQVIKIFETAISRFPRNPFYKVHLGRFYSIKHLNFDKALSYTEEGFNCADEHIHSKFYQGQFAQMCGMIYTRQIRDIINHTDLEEIEKLAQKGVEWFRRAVAICPYGVDGYIPEVRLRFEVLYHVHKSRKEGLKAFLETAEASPFLKNSILEVSDVLEEVPDNEQYLFWRSKLFLLGDHSHEEQLQFYKRLHASGKCGIASVNRLISRTEMEICKVNERPLSRIAPKILKTLDEALSYDDKKMELTMRLWVQIAPHLPVELAVAENKIDRWCAVENSLRSHFYKHVIVCVYVLQSRDPMRVEEEQDVLNNHLQKAVNALTRDDIGYCKNPDYPVLWLGKGKAMNQLVTLDLEKHNHSRPTRKIRPTERLRKLTGRIVQTSRRRVGGKIKTEEGLEVPFRGDLCDPPLLGPDIAYKKVEFYLAFNYYGCEAYNVVRLHDSD